jgi:uncharacterized protein (DUF427 family)
MSQIASLASQLFSSTGFSPVKTLSAGGKRIRATLNGITILDTRSALLVWEHSHFPHYWIPRADFVEAATVWTKEKSISGIESSVWEVATSATNGESQGPKTIKALVVPEGFNHELAGLVKIDFKGPDEWFEELDRLGGGHPKDPFHRVDCLRSGRKVKVEIDGVVVADTGEEGGVVSLWETNFPGRWYLPATSVSLELLCLVPLLVWSWDLLRLLIYMR